MEPPALQSTLSTEEMMGFRQVEQLQKELFELVAQVEMIDSIDRP
jgi:hypothetical protein